MSLKHLLPVAALLLATACVPISAPTDQTNVSPLTPPASATQPPIPAAEAAQFPSPDQQWTAVVEEGGLRLLDAAGTEHDIFPPDSTITSVTWSPDSTRLLAVQSNVTLRDPIGTGHDPIGPLTVWAMTTADPTPMQLAELPASVETPSQLQWGKWSPDGSHITFWSGVLGASVLADGLPLFVLDSLTGAITPIDDYSLCITDYHDWSPDSSRLAVTLGAGREAWRNKSLAILDVTAATITPVAAAQIPGRVAWSPDGGRIAYAANPADIYSLEYSGLSYDDPRIAARRVYLLDVTSGEVRPLNDVDSFQDVPIWNADGSVLYYIQRVGATLQLMAADPATGATSPVEGAAEPLPDLAGYYGVFIDWNNLLTQIPSE